MPNDTAPLSPRDRLGQALAVEETDVPTTTAVVTRQDVIPAASWAPAGAHFDAERVAMEVRQYEATALLASYEAGRLLLWAKEQLQGAFLEWLEENVQISERTAQMRMRLTQSIGQRAHLLPMLKDLSQNKVLALAPEDYDELEREGTIAGMTLEQVREEPYRVLKSRLEKAEAERIKAADRATHAEEEVERLNARIVKLTDPDPSADDDLAILAEARENLTAAMKTAGAALDRVATGRRSRAVQVEAANLAAFMLAWAELEEQRFQVLTNKTAPGLYQDLLRRQAELPPAARPPEDRILETGDKGASKRKGRS